MNKQKYQLGDFVYCFKAKGDDILTATGIVRMAEINHAGYVQYTVAVKNEGKTENWLVNHASLAKGEDELRFAINEYVNFMREQKQVFEKKFGKPEFSADELKEIM